MFYLGEKFMKKKLLVTMIALALSASSVACGAQKVEPAKKNNI